MPPRTDDPIEPSDYALALYSIRHGVTTTLDVDRRRSLDEKLVDFFVSQYNNGFIGRVVNEWKRVAESSSNLANSSHAKDLAEIARDALVEEPSHFTVASSESLPL